MEPQDITKIDLNGHVFKQPVKKIITQEDLEKFKTSLLFNEIMTFIFKLQKSIEGKTLSETPKNPKFIKIVEFLANLEQLLEKVPPIPQQMRFGNKAFRDWALQATPLIDNFLDSYLPENLMSAKIELKVYLEECFGSTQRIDYGTGHEFSFLLFLLCLHKIGLCEEKDFESLIRNVFYKYVEMIRKVQLQYMLEPAGSHGVWGLDDYQFLPFLFGASELINNKHDLLPEVIVNETTVQRYKQEYMFFQCIDFVLQVKKGPFHEHSPIIHSLSQVPLWAKVSQVGLLKMFQGEVLHKHPVIKHTHFGSILKFE